MNSALPSQAALLNAIRKTGFGDKAVKYRANSRFVSHEMDYKLRLAEAIKEADLALGRGESQWVDLMNRAVGANFNNIVNWRLKHLFKTWCKEQPQAAGTAIHRLISGIGRIEERLAAFSAALDLTEMKQEGAKLCIASVLLMARDLSLCPPVRAGVLKTTLKSLGLGGSVAKKSVAERYTLFMTILDALVEFSQSTPCKLADRLEAQGAIWCVVSGWMDAGESSATAVSLHGTVEEDIEAAEPELSALEETERAAIVAARRGQGKYRSGLISLWLGCSVTGCQNCGVLRASHLKPWRHSDNHERLNPYNGLLLTPNLDALLDRSWISFDEDGAIRLSEFLLKKDRLALGLHAGLRLSGVQPQHLPFLAYHRNAFHEMEAIRAGSGMD